MQQINQIQYVKKEDKYDEDMYKSSINQTPTQKIKLYQQRVMMVKNFLSSNPQLTEQNVKNWFENFEHLDLQIRGIFQICKNDNQYAQSLRELDIAYEEIRILFDLIIKKFPNLFQIIYDDQRKKLKQDEDINQKKVSLCQYFDYNGQIYSKEDRQTEYKNYQLSSFSKEQYRTVIKKTITSFLNTQGGTIYLGIRDIDITVQGVDLSRKDMDDLKLKITDIRRQIEPNCNQLVNVDFIPIKKWGQFCKGKWVVRIKVSQGDLNTIYAYKSIEGNNFALESAFREDGSTQRFEVGKFLSETKNIIIKGRHYVEPIKYADPHPESHLCETNEVLYKYQQYKNDIKQNNLSKQYYDQPNQKNQPYNQNKQKYQQPQYLQQNQQKQQFQYEKKYDNQQHKQQNFGDQLQDSTQLQQQLQQREQQIQKQIQQLEQNDQQIKDYKNKLLSNQFQQQQVQETFQKQINEKDQKIKEQEINFGHLNTKLQDMFERNQNLESDLNKYKTQQFGNLDIYKQLVESQNKNIKFQEQAVQYQKEITELKQQLDSNSQNNQRKHNEYGQFLNNSNHLQFNSESTQNNKQFNQQSQQLNQQQQFNFNNNNHNNNYCQNNNNNNFYNNFNNQSKQINQQNQFSFPQTQQNQQKNQTQINNQIDYSDQTSQKNLQNLQNFAQQQLNSPKDSLNFVSESQNLQKQQNFAQSQQVNFNQSQFNFTQQSSNQKQFTYNPQQPQQIQQQSQIQQTPQQLQQFPQQIQKQTQQDHPYSLQNKQQFEYQQNKYSSNTSNQQTVELYQQLDKQKFEIIKPNIQQNHHKQELANEEQKAQQQKSQNENQKLVEKQKQDESWNQNQNKSKKFNDYKLNNDDFDKKKRNHSFEKKDDSEDESTQNCKKQDKNKQNLNNQKQNQNQGNLKQQKEDDQFIQVNDKNKKKNKNKKNIEFVEQQDDYDKALKLSEESYKEEKNKFNELSQVFSPRKKKEVEIIKEDDKISEEEENKDREDEEEMNDELYPKDLDTLTKEKYNKIPFSILISFCFEHTLARGLSSIKELAKKFKFNYSQGKDKKIICLFFTKQKILKKCFTEIIKITNFDFKQIEFLKIISKIQDKITSIYFNSNNEEVEEEAKKNETFVLISLDNVKKDSESKIEKIFDCDRIIYFQNEYLLCSTEEKMYNITDKQIKSIIEKKNKESGNDIIGKAVGNNIIMRGVEKIEQLLNFLEPIFCDSFIFQNCKFSKSGDILQIQFHNSIEAYLGYVILKDKKLKIHEYFKKENKQIEIETVVSIPIVD